MSAIRHGRSEKLPIAGDVATNTANPNEMTNSDDVRYHAAEAAVFRCIHVISIRRLYESEAAKWIRLWTNQVAIQLPPS